MFINRGKGYFPLEKDKNLLIYLVAKEGCRGSETDGGQCEGQKAEEGFFALVTLVTAVTTYVKTAT